MQAIEISAPGGPDVLHLVERPEPVVGPGQLLLAVAASGINRPDIVQRSGSYPPPPGASDLPGLEVAGEVLSGDAAALADAGIAIGDRVCALTHGGGYAQRCAVDVAHCLPVPQGWSDVEAASLPETFFTVWANVFDRGRLQAGETLLVHGGSSGIGIAAIQLAKALGSRVIVTVGDDAKAAACLRIGADHAITYKTQDFVDEVKRLTDGKGADVVLDMVAGPYVARDLKCMAEDGRLSIIAVQGGVKAEIDAALVMRRRLTITGSTLRPRSAAYKAQLAASLRSTVWPWIEAGRIRPLIDRTYPAAQAAEAHAWMESGAHIGKIVLTW